jgi:hypothetical protein
MRAWIENDDDITPYVEIDVYEGGEMVEATGFQMKPLPWRIEFDTDDIHDAIIIEDDEEQDD